MKLAVVTGGTRRVGAAIAARLAETGYDLALHTHRDSACETALADVIARTGVEAEIFAADLADPSAIDALLPAIVDRFGRVPDCMVNSASIFEEDRWADVSVDSLLRHFAINAAAPARLTQQFAALNENNHRGVVINILDQRVRFPPDDQAGYTASKMALAEITRAQAHAFAPRLRVCGVAPGLTLPTADYDHAQLERIGAMMPLERLPTPQEIAEAVAYLATAGSVTGQVIFVDGGASLHRYPRDFVNLARAD